ncbi:DUF167 domain-containing protein [Candidatus Babeliales bacterium]|nr:DUF167 domain-containing protein [Candidatus Babeliales bacterium]
MALMLTIKVVPKSGNPRWKLESSGQLKCYLKNPPEKGKANAELIKRLAQALKLSTERIVLVSGATSRIKMIKVIADITYDQVLEALDIAQQTSFLVN